MSLGPHNKVDPAKDSRILREILIHRDEYEPESILMAMALRHVIERIELRDHEVYFYFDNHEPLIIGDYMQACCEHRYVTCDDRLDCFKGAVLLAAMVKDTFSHPDEEGGSGDHDVQVLEVLTNKGSFTVVTHNKHNGYYGGFNVGVKYSDGWG